jgi:molecular chaperone HtpG
MTQTAPIAHKIPLEPWEVGGELLDILSRGLYSDARDAMREYVQNGIDAGATNVTITTTGPVMTVRDDGSGMTWEALRKARRFGLSEKSPTEMVGYRGIGIYASFGMCESLIITTRASGMDELLQLQFDFGPMRRILEQDRAARKRSNIALADLLHQYTEFRREPYRGHPDDHFTLVRLEGVTPEYRAQLADASALHSYLLNTIPVAYPEHAYGPIVNRWLREYVGLNPIRIAVGHQYYIRICTPQAATHSYS